jgi:hypothetical protein
MLMQRSGQGKRNTSQADSLVATVAAGIIGSAGAALLFAAATAAFLAVSSPAEAASRLCRQLEARLADSAGSVAFGKYDRAVAEQRNELIMAEESAHRAGCFSGFGGLFTRGSDVCPGLLGTIDRMERNLEALERRRARLAGRGDPRRERARILAALDANGCNGGEPLRRLPGPVTAEKNRRNPLDEENRNLVGSPSTSAGTFRTLCVRTCDGYYFPISFSTTTDMFDRDRKACETQCPGTEVELHFHRVPDEESDQMISISGRPYTELPNAFKYREANYQRPEGCGCRPARNFSIIAGESSSKEAPEPAVRASEPRYGPAQDTEALTGSEPQPGAEKPATQPPAATPTTPTTKKDGEKKIRVVGPAFLPDGGEAIDLRSPGQSEVR